MIQLISPEAKAVRAGILAYQLPDTVELRFFAPGNSSSQVFPVTGAEITRTLARDRAAQDADQESPVLYWTPVIQGDRLGIEVYLPPGGQPAEVRMAIPQVSHLSASPLALAAQPLVGMGGSQPCHQDATCSQEYWGDVIPAVARMVYTQDGGTYFCSGSLINDQDTNTQIPYFITARHCISSQSEASSLQTYWFFQSQRCMRDGALPDADNLPDGTLKVISGGATLLDTLPQVDMTLLRLDTPPPAGTILVGWDANPVPSATQVTGIHHPAGDLKKITFSTVRGLGGCMLDLGTDFFSCRYEPANVGSYLLLEMDKGFLEGGSSGSGLFLNNSHKLVGTLTGANWQDDDDSGSPTCEDSQFSIFYGRFDLAFSERFHKWLAAPATGACSAQPGSWGFCADPDCGSCDVGQGDCDANSECKSGLVCAKNVGAHYGLSPLADVCQMPTDATQAQGCLKTPGSWAYCADPACGPCGEGQGDCDSNGECQTGLMCLENQGASKGFLSSVDICGTGTGITCTLSKGDWAYCSRLGCGPCNAGEGDCDADSDCASGLACARNAGAKYGLPADMDVCEAPQTLVCTRRPGDWGYCSDPACGPCTARQGDCDRDADCAEGLVCNTQEGEPFGLEETMDICVAR